MADLGDIVRKLRLWRQELPRVEPHYGELRDKRVRISHCFGHERMRADPGPSLCTVFTRV